MRAAVLHEYGTPRCDVFDEPVASGDEVVLAVAAAGVNPFDIHASSGRFYVKPPLPSVVGLDGVGLTPDGRRVYFEGTVSPYGALAERTLVAPHSLVELPGEVDDAVAAALGNSGLAALLSLDWQADLAAGESVLVLGATGSTGRLAIQIAKQLGAGRVIAAGRDAGRLHRTGELGADVCVSLEAADPLPALQDALGPGADIVIDLLWGRAAALGVQVAASGARYVQVGNAAGPIASLDAGMIRSKALKIGGYANYHVPAEARHAAYRRLIEFATAGQLQVDVERVALRDIEAAWERQQAGPSRKLVVIP